MTQTRQRRTLKTPQDSCYDGLGSWWLLELTRVGRLVPGFKAERSGTASKSAVGVTAFQPLGNFIMDPWMWLTHSESQLPFAKQTVVSKFKVKH
jgi:hypothetical protein